MQYIDVKYQWVHFLCKVLLFTKKNGKYSLLEINVPISITFIVRVNVPGNLTFRVNLPVFFALQNTR